MSQLALTCALYYHLLIFIKSSDMTSINAERLIIYNPELVYNDNNFYGVLTNSNIL